MIRSKNNKFTRLNFETMRTLEDFYSSDDFNI